MKYVTGIHALNIPCNLETSGDWHMSAIQWEHPNTMRAPMQERRQLPAT